MSRLEIDLEKVSLYEEGYMMQMYVAAATRYVPVLAASFLMAF